MVVNYRKFPLLIYSLSISGWVISVPRKGAWLRNNEVTNVNTRVGSGRRYHGDMTHDSTGHDTPVLIVLL